ncbi:enoyl-CoA hydratase/isomerase family protein [Variovorax sp. J31P179]|uniref:enoyl-CoA hydratase/isomerase family protein n=1 Tax=Variovorax sp. J31P179 TaxID=3053508 RepID=UPI00257756C9|nr:enoyl-CoA hydratase/isomerase family protein [Variovorax sp. J31P179]MDM0085378.1 enoyl-CoA hydratase/isomerase family protein [Variovorax sp. J31P179]
MLAESVSRLSALTQLNVAVSDGVALIELNCPPVNVLSRTLSDELTATLDLISELDEIRSVVLTGAGKVFCAGADMKGRKQILKEPGDLQAHSRRTRECFHTIRECTKPVVAAVNGAALGAGLAIVASCDIVVVSESASFGLPEIDVGLMGGASHAMRLFSHSLLRRMVLTGHRVGGAELHRLGIVEACVPADALRPLAIELAAAIASKSPVATRMAKQTLNAIEDMTLRDGYRYEQDMTAVISKTEDAKEAQRAFLEKREPVFSGR